MARAVSPCDASGQLWRIPRLHRGRRLCETGVLAFGRLGGGSRARLGGAALLAPRGWRVVALYLIRLLSVEPGRARLPCQLLRSRRFRQMGWQTLAERSRVGDRG